MTLSFSLSVLFYLASAPLEKLLQLCCTRPPCAWAVHILWPKTEMEWVSPLTESVCAAAQRSVQPWHTTLMMTGCAAGSPLPNSRAGAAGKVNLCGKLYLGKEALYHFTFFCIDQCRALGVLEELEAMKPSNKPSHWTLVSSRRKKYSPLPSRSC